MQGMTTLETLTDAQEREIQAIGAKYRLKLLLVHGSQANGTARAGSDLDLAAVGQEPAQLERNILELIGDLAAVFGDRPDRELDVKTLYRADPLFLYHVAKNSRLLYGRAADYHEFRAYAFKSYFDSTDLRALEKLLVRRFQDYLNEKYLHGYAR